jgi:hypothetical protein
MNEIPKFMKQYKSYKKLNLIIEKKNQCDILYDALQIINKFDARYLDGVEISILKTEIEINLNNCNRDLENIYKQF